MSTEFNLNDGAKIIVNDPSLVAGIVQVLKESADRDAAFHQKLMSLGVKAYRCNDGWVDRKNHVVTFFQGERTRGWYWGNLHLKVGDLAFLGNVCNDGYFIRINGIVKQDYSSASYHYNIVDLPIKNEDKVMKAKLKAVWRILRAKEWFYTTNTKDGYTFDYGFMASMPDKAPATEYADLILKKSARFVQAIKLSADKIFKKYHLAENVEEVLVDIDLRRFLVTHKVDKLVWENGTIKEIKFNLNEE